MQKVRGHLHSDSTPSWPTDHVARKGREMRHRRSPVLHAPRDINAGRARCYGSPSCPDPTQYTSRIECSDSVVSGGLCVVSAGSRG